MIHTSKIEIVANSLELDKILEALDRAGAPGYTVLRNVIGRGSRGIVTDDFDSTMLSNVYIFVMCPYEQVSEIAAVLRPVLKKLGGICVVSEVSWIVGGE